MLICGQYTGRKSPQSAVYSVPFVFDWDMHIPADGIGKGLTTRQVLLSVIDCENYLDIIIQSFFF